MRLFLWDKTAATAIVLASASITNFSSQCGNTNMIGSRMSLCLNVSKASSHVLVQTQIAPFSLFHNGEPLIRPTRELETVKVKLNTALRASMCVVYKLVIAAYVDLFDCASSGQWVSSHCLLLNLNSSFA